MTPDRCRSCGAPILWARTTKSKSIPLDADPCEDGNLTLIEGVAHYGALAGQRHYKSHYATCPDAARWRKGG